MIYALAKPVRQAIAVGLLLALVGSFAMLIAIPVWSHITSLDERILDARTMAGRLAERTGDDSTRKHLEDQVKQLRASGQFIEGESEPIRLAAIQSSLSALAAANSIKLRSVRNLPVRERNDLRLLGVQAQTVVPLDKLQKLMLDIEQAKPVFIIDQIQITPINLARLPDDAQNGLLDVRMDVFAIEGRGEEKAK